MARTARVKKTENGEVHYHLMSRTNDQRFLFEKGAVKSDIVDALKRAAEFSGVDLDAYSMMCNHFHIVCKVTRTDEKVPRDEIERRLVVLMGRKRAEKIIERWNELEDCGAHEALERELDRYRRRMNDISEFIKTFKEMVNIRFKRMNKYCGSIWSGRFKSTIIESGEYLARCCRYVELNPVRAGMVTRAADYRWSSAGDPAFRRESAAGSVPSDAGSVPEGWLMRRVAQIGAGKIFGSYEFVTEMAYALGNKFSARSVAARRVGETGYSTHGHRLAAELAAASAA